MTIPFCGKFILALGVYAAKTAAKLLTAKAQANLKTSKILAVSFVKPQI